MSGTRLLQVTMWVCLLVAGFAGHSLAQTDQKTICGSETGDRAFLACDLALGADKTDHVSYFNRANLWAGLQNYNRALSDFDESIRFGSKNPAAYLGRGLIFHTKEKYDSAIADFSTAIQLNPSYSTAYNARGATWMSLGNYVNSISDFTETIRLDPQNVIAYVSRGEAFTKKKEYEFALIDFNEAIRRNPIFVNAYLKRALVFENKREITNAISDYTEVIKIEPSSWLAYKGRAKLFEQVRNYEQALVDITQAKALAPSEAEFERSLGSLKQAISPVADVKPLEKPLEKVVQAPTVEKAIDANSAENQIRSLLDSLPNNPLVGVTNEFLAKNTGIVVVALIAGYLLLRNNRKKKPVEQQVAHDFLTIEPRSFVRPQPPIRPAPMAAPNPIPNVTSDNADPFQMVTAFFPNVKSEYEHLACYGVEAQKSFIEKLSATRLFQTPEPVREEIIRDILISKFGFDEMVQNFGRYLLETGNVEAANYLSRLVTVLGDMVPAEKLISDTEQKILALRMEAMRTFNQNASSTSSGLSKTRALSGAAALIACGVILYMFRGEVVRVYAALSAF